MAGPRVKVPTCLDLHKWEEYLCTYIDNLVIDSLKYGWPLNFQGDFIPESTFSNHPSAVRLPTVLQEHVAKELAFSSIIGPFRCNPFNVPCVISPLMCVPKRDSNEYRIVHDLSFPHAKSVNSGIPKDTYLSKEFKLRLPGVDRLVSFVLQKGRGCKVFKRDLKRAYRQLAVDPKDIPLLGFQVDNMLYFHRVLPFGGRSCVMCCQRTTKSVVFMLAEDDISVDVYIDDFFGAESEELAEVVFSHIIELFDELHLEAAIEKDISPTCEMLCLGIIINTISFTLSVPEFRIVELLGELDRWRTLQHMSKRNVQCLLGKLSYVAACVKLGRPFMASLINSLAEFSSPQCKRPVSSEIKEDLEWWRLFLQHYNGVSLFPGISIIDDVNLFSTDVCRSGDKGGCGAICLNEYFQMEFPTFIAELDLPIPQLELLTIMVAMKLWKEKLCDHVVTLYSDSESAVFAIQNRRSKNEFMQLCLKELFLCLALANIVLEVKHVPGKFNLLGDYLSRWHLDERYRTQFLTLTGDRILRDIDVDDNLFKFSFVGMCPDTTLGLH